jgi:hypothetical protein
MLKASDLQGVLQFFRPNERLDPPRLQAWFVEREGSPRKKLRVRLTALDPRQKLLFVGHRGSSKTTELLKLAEDLHDHYETVGFDMLNVTGRTVVTYEDVMRTISTQVTQTCIERHLLNRPLLDPVRDRLRDISDWWAQVVAGSATTRGADETNVALAFKAMLAEIEVSARQSSTSRDAINFQLAQAMPQLIRHLDWVVEQAELAAGKRLLIVVEGLDKVDLDAARSIFREHSATLTAPRATMLYTFPLPLRYSEYYNEVLIAFNDAVEYFPNMPARRKDGTDNPPGVEALRKLALRRLDERLIDADALDHLVRCNGGIPARLVTLMQRAALYALERDAARIAFGDAEQAVKDLRRELRAPLTSQEIAILRERHRDRTLFNDEDERRLLQKGALIDYSNGDSWCDAHPALWPLLEQDDDDGQRS